MASLIRSAKSASGWTQHELQAYNIQVVEQSLTEFFNQNQLPPVPPAVHHFCEITDRMLAPPSSNTYRMLHYLDLVQSSGIGPAGREAAVDDFASRLLGMLEYNSGRRAILVNQSLPLMICGIQCSAQPDVCICDSMEYVLLVQEDKRLGSRADPEPQLIAQAIGAYQRNNYFRDILHDPTLDEITFPAITLVGTFPTFYKIRVTAELSNAVTNGIFPINPTVAYRHTPQLPRSSGEGMGPLENRTTIIQYYEAFRAFV